jgi:hypothetical protein
MDAKISEGKGTERTPSSFLTEINGMKISTSKKGKNIYNQNNIVLISLIHLINT